MNRLTACIVVVVVFSAIPAAVGAPPPDSAQSAQPSCSFPFSATDATGTNVTVDSEPGRVVALQPSAAQTMWEINAQQKVVGMPLGPTTSYLNDSGSRTDVTGEDGFSTSVETVVSLNPDLVLAPNSVPNQTIETLRSAGLTVYKFGMSKSITDVSNKTIRTGQLVGACGGANQRVDAMNETVKSIKSATEGRDRPRVLYVMEGGYTPGNGTFIHEIITVAGGENIAATANITGYQPINPETVIKQDPQWIITQDHMSTLPNRTEYAETTALEQNQTVSVDSNYVSQPGPRVVQPMKTLAETFHPDAFEGTDASSPSEEGTDATTPPAQTTEAMGPGFGVVAGVLAVLTLMGALFARR